MQNLKLLFLVSILRWYELFLLAQIISIVQELGHFMFPSPVGICHVVFFEGHRLPDHRQMTLLIS